MKKNEDIQMFQEKKEFYAPKYGWCLDLIDQQNSLFWRFSETNPADDFNDLHNKLTEAELHGIKETLKLFTLYELDIGSDYWGGIVRKVFKHPEIQMLATTNSYYEVVHARFYNEINKCMGLDTKEFYTEYKNNKVLSERMEFIENACKIPKNYDAMDILKSLSTFLFVEGAVLYSSFAFIKHFSSNGKNLLKNVNAGIDYSIRDESGHVTSGELLYKTLLDEAELTDEEYWQLKAHIVKIAKKTYEHEEQIMDKFFSKGKIHGITEHQLKTFIKARINECLGYLDIEPIYAKESYNPIEGWFYDNISTLKLTDFFFKQSAQYTRDWDKSRFIW